jgi:hypothetical protein
LASDAPALGMTSTSPTMPAEGGSDGREMVDERGDVRTL